MHQPVANYHTGLLGLHAPTPLHRSLRRWVVTQATHMIIRATSVPFIAILLSLLQRSCQAPQPSAQESDFSNCRQPSAISLQGILHIFPWSLSLCAPCTKVLAIWEKIAICKEKWYSVWENKKNEQLEAPIWLVPLYWFIPCYRNNCTYLYPMER